MLAFVKRRCENISRVSGGQCKNDSVEQANCTFIAMTRNASDLVGHHDIQIFFEAHAKAAAAERLFWLLAMTDYRCGSATGAGESGVQKWTFIASFPRTTIITVRFRITILTR
jgi:hypothetical protein